MSLPNGTDPVHVVGHITSVFAILATWMGVLTPIAGFIASCCAIAWYITLFLEQRKKNKRNV